MKIWNYSNFCISEFCVSASQPRSFFAVEINSDHYVIHNCRSRPYTANVINIMFGRSCSCYKYCDNIIYFKCRYYIFLNIMVFNKRVKALTSTCISGKNYVIIRCWLKT